MGGVNYLNLEYIITRTYDFAAGIQFDPNMIPDWVAGLTHDILLLGMLLSVILLVLVVYAQLRMVQVEHEGFHAIEEEEHERQAQVHGPEGETRTGSRWDDIVALASSPNESDWRRAILEADIMLGDVLAEAGYEGVSVGEQLKITNPLQVKTLRLAWEAHMVRNRVAHDGAALDLTERDVLAAIDQYKRVFEEFGKI
jgi:hypothetical protein